MIIILEKKRKSRRYKVTFMNEIWSKDLEKFNISFVDITIPSVLRVTKVQFKI